MPTVDTPRITLTGSMPAITVNVITGTGGGGTSVHNQLTGRSADDAHPISAITGLQEALDTIPDVSGLVDTSDARLSDARTPTAHKSSHENGGGDELALDASQITTGTVDQARLGTGTADNTTYLRGDQTWAAVTPGASALNDLTDVDTATDPPATDDVLAWDGTLWTPAALTAADTGAIPESIIDAKGDLVVGTAADTAARLAVGTNGQVLTADSSEAGGVKWAAAGGDVSVAGNCRVFAPQTDGYGWAMWVGGSTVSISNTIVTASFPFTVTEDCTLSTLRIEVVTGAASATHQLALFSCDVNGTPGSLIETFTAFDCSNADVKGISGLTTALHAGSIYMLASLGGATSGHSLRGTTTGGGGLVLANGAVVLEIATLGNLTGGSVGRGAGWRFTVDVPGVMTDPPGGSWAHAPTNLTIPNIGMVLT